MICNKLIPFVIAGAFHVAAADTPSATRLDTAKSLSENRTTSLRTLRKTKQRRPRETKMNKEEATMEASKKTKSTPTTSLELAPIVQPAGVPDGFIENNPNDLGLRFSKNPLINPPATGSPFLELVAGDFPLTLEKGNVVRSMTSGISIILEQDCKVCEISIEDLVKSTKVEATFPSSDSDSDFWDELWEVTALQIYRMNDADPTRFLKLPQIWTGFSIEDVAQAVNDEYPGTHHVALLGQLFGGGLDRTFTNNCPTCAGVDRSIIPIESSASFVHGIAMLSGLVTWAFGVVAPQNFQTKWHIGRPRPEEIMWKIYTGELTSADGVPQYIIDGIKNNFDVTRMQEFTAYEVGAPTHPAFPAMHSASSSASLWLAVVLDLTPEQICEAKAVDYAIAYARTVAGVHYYTDNIAGLNLGQEILAREMPEYFEQKYGSDKAAVQAKIDMLRFDWNDYLTSDCFPAASR